MTNNENIAHSTAYDKTRKIRAWTSRVHRLYIQSKGTYDRAVAARDEAYEKIYQETLAELESE
jgi:hypothetical protein